MYSRVEWFSTFIDFLKPTHFCWSVIFLGTQFQKIDNIGTRGKVFIFKKSQGTLKINIFIWKLAETFLNPYTSKNNTKIKFEIFLFNFFFSPKLGKTIFDLYKVKINIFLNFTSFVALKDQRIPSPCRRLQKRHTNFVCADFRVTVQIFWGPATKERGNIETLNFGIGVQQQIGTK